MNAIKILKTLLVICIAFTVSSCNKEMAKPYDNPFFYIHFNNAEVVTVPYNRTQTTEYKVYFSTKSQFETITLQYAFEVGNGLKEGVDFEIVSPNRSLAFAPGIIERSIAIRWLSNPIDPTKDNSLTIRLLGNDKGITIGLPGPDKKQSSLKFIKI